MGQSLLFVWFGMGKMPEPVRARALAEGALVFSEGQTGWLRRNGSLPDGSLSHGVRSMLGAFAITPSRVVITLGKRVPVDVPIQPADGAAASITVDERGLRLAVDVARAVRGGSGTLELSFNESLADGLAALPFRTLPINLPERDVIALFRAYR